MSIFIIFPLSVPGEIVTQFYNFSVTYDGFYAGLKQSLLLRNIFLVEKIYSNFFTKISLIFSYFSLKKFKNKLDPRKYNGAIFLGLNGPVVKSHGSTDALGFFYSIDLSYKIVTGNLMNQIKKNLNHLKNEK